MCLLHLEKIDVPRTAEGRAGSFYYISPLVFIVMQSLTPLIGGLREMPLRPETWREKSIFNTTWAKKWHHLTSPGGWGVIYDGKRCHFISQGSVINNSSSTFVVEKVNQQTARSLQDCSFHALKHFTQSEAQGKQFMLLHEVKIQGGWIIQVTEEPTWLELHPTAVWHFTGSVHDFNVAEGINLPTPASSLLHECTREDHMFIFGMCMDGTSPYTFSNSLSGTNFLYLRPWCLRASYNHFGIACAAIPDGVDPSLALGMLGRDVALMESGLLHTPRVMDDGSVRWQRIFAHLGNFISDRAGSDNPLGRIHVAPATKSEWKGFVGHQEGFGIGPRNDGFHQFAGNARIFRSVCTHSPNIKPLTLGVCLLVHGLCASAL